MPDYNKTVIYKISCNDENIKELYIGHTTNFKRRKWEHASSCNNEKSKHYNSFVYQFIRMNGGFDNWNFVKLYDFPCSSLKEARIAERNCMEKFGGKLNTINSYLTDEERIEYKKLNCKEWRINNVEKLRLYDRKYQEENREKLNEKKREYYQINKEKITLKNKEYNNTNVNCPNCNLLLNRCSLYKHKKRCKSD